MEWIAEWDWENKAMFTSKACGNSKKPQTTDWEFEEEEIDAGSFNMSGQSGVSGSDVGNGSSAKSSISASIQCLPKEAMEISNLIFAASECSFGNLSRKKESNRAELAGSFSRVEASVGPGEPLVGLKLGKRTYFENNFAISKEKATTFSVVPVSSATAAKKTKSSCQTAPVARCQVEGCNLDLSSAKDYHRKHRVCEKHSKIPKVIIGGLELRFCQQCSRFHRLSEFDENKRSCRRRLSDHNARRHKPKQETIQFHSTRFSSSFYEAGQQMNFLISNTPLVHTRPAANLPWDSCGSKFLLTEGCQLNSEKAGVIGGKPTVVGIKHLHATNISDSSRLLSLKGTTSDNFVQGFKDPILSSSPDAALDLHRALSLLSSNTWGSCEQQLITFDEPMDVVGSVSMSPQHMDAVP